MRCQHDPWRKTLRRLAMAGLVGGMGLALGACGTPGQDLTIQVAPAPPISPEVQVGAEVGRLLSPDAGISKQAERRLLALTGEDLERFLAYALALEGESDMRLFNILDEHHALPELGSGVLLSFLLWKSAPPERFYRMKAQSRLIVMATADPEPLIQRLGVGGKEVDVLAAVLATTQTEAAVPALLQRYRSTGNPRSRAAAAAALGVIAGEEHRPRPSGRAQDLERDATAIEAWYRERLEMKEDAATEDTK